MSLPAGKLNRRISVQRIAGFNELDQPLDEWADFCQAWAWHKPLNGRSGFKSGLVTAINGNSWRIRYSQKHLEIEAGMQVVYSGKAFKITRIVVDYERKEYIDLICEEDGAYA